jgi:hypothetical protein
MEQPKKETDEENCLNSISFYSLGTIIFISESFSALLSILILIFTSWKFLKNVIKILNIISLCIIFLIIFINIIMFCTLKNIQNKILNKYKTKLVGPVFSFIFCTIIIIFNIYNAIYLSIKLHIADYPEYGGRKRDQEYIDSHPDEFGDVEIHEFIIVGICPSLISICNLLCIIMTCLYRSKIVLLYNTKYKEKYGLYPDEDEENRIKREKEKEKKKHHKRKRESFENAKSNDELANNNESDPSAHKIKGKKNEEPIQIKINNYDEREENEKKLPKDFYFGNIKFDNTATSNGGNEQVYNKKLPDNFYFGGRIIQNSDEKELEFNLNNKTKKSLLNSLKEDK